MKVTALATLTIVLALASACSGGESSGLRITPLTPTPETNPVALTPIPASDDVVVPGPPEGQQPPSDASLPPPETDSGPAPSPPPPSAPPLAPAPTPTPAPDDSELLYELGYNIGYPDGYGDGSVGDDYLTSFYIDPTIGVGSVYYPSGYADGYADGYGDGRDYFETIPRGCLPNC